MILELPVIMSCCEKVVILELPVIMSCCEKVVILELPVIMSCCCREGCDPGVTCDFVMLLM